MVGPILYSFRRPCRSGDNKEKLSTNVRSEYASDFCYDRKSAFSHFSTLSDSSLISNLIM